MDRSRPPTAPRRRAVLRAVAIAAAVGLGILAVCLVVLGSSVKTERIGALAGFWGLLIGASVVFGNRPGARDAASAEDTPAERAFVEGGTGPADPSELGSGGHDVAHDGRTGATPGRELDLRRTAEVERAAEAAARREFEHQLRGQLQTLVRQELRENVGRELADLRAEVGALRSELLEKLGGQLQLERTETTRLIGSDLAALQNELRRLRENGGIEGVTAPAAPVRPTVVAPVQTPAPTPVPATVAPRPDKVVDVRDAEIVPDPDEAPVAAPAPAAAPVPAAAPAAATPPAAPAPVRAPDPFADLPRLTPFTEFDLDDAGEAVAEDDDAPRGRRYRSDDDVNDTLARILAREGRR